MESTQGAVSSALAGKRIVLGVTGGIAAYKAIEVCRRLRDLGAHVVPVLTQSAHHMVGPTTFTALASEPVKTSLWSDPDPIPHTTMGQQADAIVVCPATARIISDLRTGRSADLLSATLIATMAPVVVCPAMHTEMWEHPAVAENIEVLVRRGVKIVPPEEGRLAGGDVGTGRLAAPATIVEAVLALFEADSQSGPQPASHHPGPDLRGRRVLVTAGGTREPLDPVRFLGNRSTGKQGHAIAIEAAERGASVVLVTTSNLPTPAGIERIEVETADEMHGAVTADAEGFDVIVMAAAVADFRPVKISTQKIKKQGAATSVDLEPTIDILASLGSGKPDGQVLVGFAAETENLAENALGKLRRKGADLLVANDVSAPGVGFSHDTNAVTIFRSDGSVREVGLSDKKAIAAVVIDEAAGYLTG